MDTSDDVRSQLHRHAAILSAASGTVHLAVIDDHLGSVLLIGAFAAMGLAQWATAAGLWRHRSWADWTALTVQPLIIMLWVASRTVGIPLVTGWGAPEQLGVSDVVATAFGAAVVVLVVASRYFPAQNVTFKRGPGLLQGLTVALVLLVLVPAVSAPHTHSTTDHDVHGEHHDPPVHRSDHDGNSHQHDSSGELDAPRR